MKKILFSLFAICISFAAFSKDIKTVVFTVTPEMHCQKCETKVKNQLKFEKGIKGINPSSKENKIVLKYDADKTTPQKLASSLKKIGYEATVVTDDKK